MGKNKGEYSGMDDSQDDSQLISKNQTMKKSMFQAGDDLYRSIYKRPMQSSMWVFCWKIEKAPLLILTILISLDIIRYLFYTYIGIAKDMMVRLTDPGKHCLYLQLLAVDLGTCRTGTDVRDPEPKADGLVDQNLLCIPHVASG